jgi:uridine kinase
MTFVLPAGEPQVQHWRAVEERELVEQVLAAAGDPQGRPRIVAVDGRGAAGKSTLAAHLQRAVPAAAVLHTDDLAWNEPFFGWGHLLMGVLRQLRDGEGVSLSPPAWAANGRTGTIEVPAGLALVVVEGVGASHREHAELIDATVWVQSDFAEAERRGIARDVEQGVNGDTEQTVTFWHEWMSHELAFLQQQRPWERASLVVAGTPVIPLEPGQLAVSPGPL